MDSLERRARRALRPVIGDRDGPAAQTRTARELFLPLAAGAAAFGGTCAASCASQLAVGVSTGSLPRLLPTAAGVGTVAAASLASHWAAAAAQTYQRTGRLPTPFRANHQHTSSSSFLPPPNKYHQHRPSDEWLAQRMRICLLGLLTFRLLGGRFWAVAPSSWTAPGSFARASLPATERYATAAQRRTLQALGRRWGCHTCGSRMRFAPRSAAARFVGDHMPPKSVAAERMEQLRHSYRRWLGLRRGATKFKFYPQCAPCSNRQGSLLSAATRRALRHSSKKSSFASLLFRKPQPSLAHAGGGTNAHFHGWRPRTWHWTGSVVAATAVHEPARRSVDRLERWTRRQWRQLQRQLPE